MCCLTFSEISLFRKALLQCEIHIITKFNNPQQVLFTENYCLTKVYFVSDQFSVNGFVLFCLLLFFNPLPICSQGEENLIPRFFPGAGGFGTI